MKTTLALLSTLCIVLLSSCGLVVESKISYYTTKASTGSVLKVIDKNAAKANLGRVEIPNQPYIIGYSDQTDRRVRPSSLISTFVDLKLGEISISEGLVVSPSKRMLEFENGLRRDLHILGVLPK